MRCFVNRSFTRWCCILHFDNSLVLLLLQLMLIHLLLFLFFINNTILLTICNSSSSISTWQLHTVTLQLFVTFSNTVFMLVRATKIAIIVMYLVISMHYRTYWVHINMSIDCWCHITWHRSDKLYGQCIKSSKCTCCNVRRMLCRLKLWLLLWLLYKCKWCTRNF